MEKNFIIECRYEIFGKNGKEFIPWFTCDAHPMSEEEAKNKIKQIKNDFGYIDVKTKLKHEYRLADYNEYLKQIQQLKENNERLTEKQKAYFQSEEYKELCKKKRQSAKERKEKQKKYLEEHQNDN